MDDGTDPVEHLRRTLVWSATGRGAAPTFTSLPYDRSVLVDALLRHRLPARFLHHTTRAGVVVPEDIGRPMIERQMEARRRIEGQIRLFAGIRHAYRQRCPGEELIMLKGCGLHLLSGADQHLRYSGDLDLLGRDPAAVLAAAEAFTQAPGRVKDHSHEYGDVVAHLPGVATPECEVDVHYRYTFTQFPDDVERGDLDPRRHPGVWRIANTFEIGSIGYEDLRPHLRTVRHGDSEIPVPAPEIAALLRCAHLCLDVMMHPHPLPTTTVSLDELVTIADLVRLDGFDSELFASLCERHGAQLVTALVRYIGVGVLGFDPLAPAADRLPAIRSWFPVNLWWDGVAAGLPVHLDWRPDDLVVRADGLPPIVDRLAPDVVDISLDGGSSHVLREGTGRYLASRERLDGAEVTFTPHRAGLRITARLPLPDDDRISAIAVNVDDFQYEIFLTPPERVAFGDYSYSPVPAGSVRAEGSAADGCHAFLMDLSWPALNRRAAPSAGDELKILFKARQQRPGWGPVIGTMIAPIVLRIPSRS